MGFTNVVHLEYQDPQSNFVLYRRNQLFTEDIQRNFPLFYEDLRDMLGRPNNEEGVAFFMYNIFAVWKNLVPQMRKKIPKIKTLVISDRHQAHAGMIKDFIEYEFSEQISSDFFSDMILTPEVIKELDYDLIVTAFAPDGLENIRSVYIPNVPNYDDYANIQKHIDEIIKERMY